MARGRVRLVVLASVVLIATGVWASRAPRGHGRGAPGGGAAALESAIADVEAWRKTTPLISGPTPAGDFTVTFLAKSSDGQVPRVVSDATGWGENIADNTFDFTIGRMKRTGPAGWYSLEARVVPGARVEYLIVHGNDYRPDPHNPRRQELHSGSPASEFVTPGYTPPEEFADAPGMPAGTATETIVMSRALGGWRRVIVYTPPGYRRNADYPVAVFQNGVSLMQGGKAPAAPDPAITQPAIESDVPPRLLDHLIARHVIEPIVAVFVESQRYGDPNDHPAEAVRAFLVRDVPDWVTSRYGAGRSADKRAILAVSFAAKDALDAAVASPAAFGRLGLLIPGRRVGRESDIVAMVGKATHRMRAAILAGLYDHANLPTARALRQALNDAGHAVDYIEVPEGHTPTTWRNHVQEVLVALFKPSTTS